MEHNLIKKKHSIVSDEMHYIYTHIYVINFPLNLLILISYKKILLFLLFLPVLNCFWTKCIEMFSNKCNLTSHVVILFLLI